MINCRGWRMAMRCAETSSEHGLCHRLTYSHTVMMGGWMHETLAAALWSSYFDGVTSHYHSLLQIKSSYICRHHCHCPKLRSHDLRVVTWPGAVVNSADNCWNLTPSWNSKRFTELLWVKPHPPVMSQCTDQYTFTSTRGGQQKQVSSWCWVTL